MRPRLRLEPEAIATILVVIAFVVLGAGLERSLRPGGWLAHQLDVRFDRGPYGAAATFFGKPHGLALPSYGPATALADNRGEGFDQLIQNAKTGLSLVDHDGHTIRYLDQFNLPPAFTQAAPFAALLAPYDIDGDGRSEVVAVASRQDRAEWRLWVVDIEGQTIKGEVVLPHGPDVRRPDGVWDGSYIPVASLPVPGRKIPAVLLVCRVLFDVDGRGVLAVDPLAGEVLWRFEMGCFPQLRGIEVVDLDRDGRPEIVLATTSPNNLKGELINHTTDDSTRVFVLDAAGELRWQRALSGRNDWSGVAVADLDRDGRPEVITVASDVYGRGGRLSVWSGSGDLLFDAQDLVSRPNAVQVVESVEPEPPVVVVMNNDGRLESYRWHGRGLDLMACRRVFVDARLLGVVDALPGQQGQQVVLSELEHTRLLDAALRTQALLPTEMARLNTPPLVWNAGPDRQYLILPGATRNFYSLHRQSLLPLWLKATAAGAALVTIAAVGPLVARWRRARARIRGDSGLENDPAVRRALRREMLGLLEKGGHEKIGVLKALRRLVWHLEAAVSSALPSDGAPRTAAAADPARQRALDAAATFRREGLPLLREVLSLARRTAVAPHLAATVADILDEVEALLQERELARDDLAGTLASAKRLNRDAEAALQRLRRAVEETFRCSLPRTVSRVLDAQAEALRDGGVLVEVAGADPGDGAPWVHVDPPDLEFILDNLVGNAVRAMDGSPRRVLQVGWTEQRGRVECRVADTGCGIAPDDWERIFEPGASDRQEGGLGLARSRRELGIYGGSLRVAASRPAGGTTFVLSLPPSRIAGGGGEAAVSLRLLEGGREA